MTIREQLEQRELQYLSPYATKSSESKGRKREEVECDIRPVFQRDRDRILHSKSFRRLKQKTQVLNLRQRLKKILKMLRLQEENTLCIDGNMYKEESKCIKPIL